MPAQRWTAPRSGATRTSVVLGVLVALLALAAGLVAPVATAAPASSGPAAAQRAQGADEGRVRGEIRVPRGERVPRLKLAWFTDDWAFIDSRRIDAAGYTLTLPPGTYRLQFTDLRPAYLVDKFAPSDVRVVVRAGSTTTKAVRLVPGAAIGGVVRTGGKRGAGAKVVAANEAEQAFSVQANKKGQFALGGLPAGSYSVFTYDKKKTWVGKSTYVPKLQSGSFTPVNIALKQRAGTLILDLYAGGKLYKRKAFLTAVSRQTGQFWTAASSRGSITFAGLYPGRYVIHVPTLGNYLPVTVKPDVRVKPRRVSFGSVRSTKRGGWVTGIVVDGNDTSYPLANARVRLFDGEGSLVDQMSSRDDGSFTLGGALTTRDDLTVVAGPQEFNPYLGQGTHYCKYDELEVSGFPLVTGEETDLGLLPLPHAPDEEQDGQQCWTYNRASATR